MFEAALQEFFLHMVRKQGTRPSTNVRCTCPASTGTKKKQTPVRRLKIDSPVGSPVFFCHLLTSFSMDKMEEHEMRQSTKGGFTLTHNDPSSPNGFEEMGKVSHAYAGDGSAANRILAEQTRIRVRAFQITISDDG
jgi:hypothetical protein